MKLSIVTAATTLLIALPFACSVLAQDPAGPLGCDNALTSVWNDRTNNSSSEFEAAVRHTLDPATTPACGSDYVFAAVGQVADRLYRPVRRSLFEALQNYSSQQQETSSSSATASVTPISRPAGVTAIAEEFSGVNINSGTSALTFTLTPGSALRNAETESLVLPCSPTIRIVQNCVGSSFQKLLDRLTVTITANTSTAGQSIKGTALSSATPATPTSLSLAGTTEPSFGSFGVKAVAIYANAKAGATAPQPSFDQNLSVGSAEFQDALLHCGGFQQALTVASHVVAIDSATQERFLDAVHSQETGLGGALIGCLETQHVLESRLQNYLAAVLVVQANNSDEAKAQSPLLGFEYDLNTPVAQPSYSSIKTNFSFTMGRSTRPTSPQRVDCAKTSPSIQLSACSAALIATRTDIAGSHMAQAAAAGFSDESGAAKGAKATAEQRTPPVTINVSASAELYNSEPSSAIPGASELRDVQAGAEIDLLVPISHLAVVGGLIGDGTLAGTYYYQDQTSPSILKGPPSTITIANLPSNASQVYATRGPINLGQIRFGLGTGSNVKFPICFTYANRSALVAHPIKGLQFGITYNLSSLSLGAK